VGPAWKRNGARVRSVSRYSEEEGARVGSWAALLGPKAGHWAAQGRRREGEKAGRWGKGGMGRALEWGGREENLFHFLNSSFAEFFLKGFSKSF